MIGPVIGPVIGPRIRAFIALVLLAALPAAAQQGPRPPAPRPPERELTIQNQSGRTITELYASSTDDSEWGRDKLGDNTLPAGRSFRVRFGRTTHCTFDVRVVYEDGSAEEARDHDACRERQLSFDGSNASGGQPEGEDRSFELTNHHSRTIYQVFAGQGDAMGDDLLGAEVLSAGGMATIQFRGGCEIRLRIVFDNDAAEERRDVDVCEQNAVSVGPGWTTADDLAAFTPGTATPGAPAGGFTLVNQSGRGILILYVFPDGAGSRGPDRLGMDIVSDGARFPVRLSRGDNCLFTVRVVYDGADPDEERAGIDLCNTNELIITAGWTEGALPDARATGRIRNAGTLPIVELYAHAEGTPRGPDRLGSDIVAAGSGFALVPPTEGECRYSVTGVFRDGREVSVVADLCSGAEVTLQ